MKIIPQLNHKEFLEWEKEIKCIHSQIDENDILIGKLQSNKNPFYWVTNHSKILKLMEENKKLLDISEKMFDELQG